MKPRIAFSTLACPTWTWDELVQKGADYGYDGVEIRLLHGETDLLSLDEFRPEVRAERRAECVARGFQVCGLGSSVRFDYATRAEQEPQFDICRGYLELARDLGAEFVRVFGDTLPNGDEAAKLAVMDRMAADMEQLAPVARETGVTILIETHGDFAASARMEQLLSRISAPEIGVLWDTHHPWRFYDEDLAETFSKLKSRVGHTHWKDSIVRPPETMTEEMKAAEARASSLMSGHRPADYVLFGGGDFPGRSCMRLLKEAGYTGWFSLEWEKAWHPQLEPPEIALPLFPGKMHELWEIA